MPVTTSMFRASGLTPSQRLLLAFGAVMAATGLFHVGVWLAAGQPSLVGPVSWRKPIVFGLSIGVLAWSLAWVLGHMQDGRALRIQTRALVGLLTVELLLIDMQQWRGVPSHFNVATTFDAIVFDLMGMLIVSAAVILGWWTWRLFSAPHREAPREQLAAARAAMLLLGAGNAMGVTLVALGAIVRAATGDVPHFDGAAGNVKLSHAVALHAMQVLPVIGVLLAAVPDALRRLRLMRLAAVGYAGLLLVLATQGLAGRPPADLTPVTATLLAASLAALAVPAARGLWARLGAGAPVRRLGGVL
jgi:hypothetical protein